MGRSGKQTAISGAKIICPVNGDKPDDQLSLFSNNELNGEKRNKGALGNEQSNGESSNYENTQAAPYTLNQFPIGEDLLQQLAENILLIAATNHIAPDLSNVTVILSNIESAPRLRKQLLRHAAQYNHTALLGPNIFSLSQWANENSIDGTEVIHTHARELMLVEALMQYPHLYGHGNPWTMANSLIELFDELSLQHTTLPETYEQFSQQVSLAYGVSKQEIEALNQESQLVYTLWNAMQQQLHSIKMQDTQTVYLRKLIDSCHNTRDHTLFFAGCFNFSNAEYQCIRKLADHNNVNIISHAAISPSMRSNESQQWPATTDQNNTVSEFFDTVFSNKDMLLQRSKQYLQLQPHSPIADQYHIFSANGSEQEATIIDIQVRRWLLDGKTNIGIVTDNRLLARRIRALLERAQVTVHDTSGWALSTTSAATVVERWLQTVEDNFHYSPLLDFLKSPFTTAVSNTDKLATIYKFEQSIVIQENVSSGIQNYRDHLSDRLKRLNKTLSGYYKNIPALLDSLEYAAEPLKHLLDKQDHAPLEFVEALEESLKRIGVYNNLLEDEAGKRVLQELNVMKLALKHVKLKLDWLQFRIWLGHILESYNFKPSQHTSNVQFLNLAHSDLLQFDALVIASAERENLPNLGNASPFFNDSVRANLGLDTRRHKWQNNYYYFRRLLECTRSSDASRSDSNGNILITLRTKDNDEDIIASPWVEAIQSFHRLTYKNDLSNSQLAALSESYEAQLKIDSRDLPEAIPAFPNIAISQSLIPKTLSASAYQQLMDCPYQFFAARCLKLSPPESIRLMLEKSDFGERAHACLQAFHGNVHSLPGPFKDLITPSNRQQAEDLLTDISEKIFATDIDNNFLHKGWLQRFQSLIKDYIDWQMQRQQSWQVAYTEKEYTHVALSKQVSLSGRLDRIDQHQSNLAIVDYKTGRISSEQEVMNGESVQLPYYALLTDLALMKQFKDNHQQVSRVEYLSLTPEKLKSKATVLENEQLSELKTAIGNRLIHLIQDIHAGTPLPAWGDVTTCSYCSMKGLCRNTTWLSS